MNETLLTITVPAWVLILFGTLFLLHIISSLILAYLKAKLAKLTEEKP